MAALLFLLAAGFGLLALGAVGRAAPRQTPSLQAALCLAGLAAALLAPGVVVAEFGLGFAVDGLSATLLVPLFLLGACGAAAPVVVGSLTLALLAADAAGSVLFLGAASLAAPLPWAGPGRGMARAALPALAFAALLCLAFHGGWPVWRFAALRTLAPGIAAVVLLPAFAMGAALAAAATVPAPVGAVAGLYLLSRLLLDLPGSVTPGWWGAPVLLAGSLASVLLARRGATADNITAAVADAGLAMAGLAGAALGVALLARAADLPPLTALAVGAALLLTLVNALTGALLGRAAQAIGAAVGTNDLARLGGLLRRMPGTGLALLLALASTASVPLTPGFAGTWLMLQALLGAARLGGTAILALIAAAVAASGLVLALLAGNALRLAGLALLGAPRCAAAAAAAETTAPARLPMAALGLAVVALGIIPAAGLLVVQPGIRLLAGVALSSSSVWGLAAGDDAPGYAAIGLAALLIACTAAAARLGRTATVPGPAWRGGLAADGPAALNTLPVVLWPAWKQVRLRFTSRTVLLGLTLLLAVALGWAAR